MRELLTLVSGYMVQDWRVKSAALSKTLLIYSFGSANFVGASGRRKNITAQYHEGDSSPRLLLTLWRRHKLTSLK